MTFYTRKRSRPTVPIVSLIDILAILLIFFIVTTTFKEKKTLLNINLPTTKKLATATETAERVSISADSDGQVFFDGEEVEPGDLADLLKSFKERRPEAKLELKADETVPLGTVVSIWDALTTAGFKIREVPARITVDQASDPSDSR